MTFSSLRKVSCVKKVICAASTWKAMKELNRLFSSSVSPDVNPADYRSLSGVNRGYTAPTIPRRTVHCSEQQPVTDRAQATLPPDLHHPETPGPDRDAPCRAKSRPNNLLHPAKITLSAQRGPQFPTKGPAQRKRASFKPASSDIRGAAHDDVETAERILITDQQHGSHLGTDRDNDGSDGRHQPLGDELECPNPMATEIPRTGVDDNGQILDEPRDRLSAADQVRKRCSNFCHRRFRAVNRRRAEASVWGLNEPVITESSPPPYEAVLLQQDGFGNNVEERSSPADGRRRHVTAPVPPWDADLVDKFRNDPRGRSSCLIGLPMPASINVQAEKYNVFSIRAKYNNQQMIQKLRYSEFDAGCAVGQDIETYFKANPHRIRT
ncbi:uncharacterized protein BT62DRAFT_999289 [Guyanagaster necrorhizus]|uniref:Uncharacterized protein n=1 Tax=Guyanagaster necrorhizus TaxID=856835 RepID=A0A9P7W685_9AGAR|nr:uncharacterized protein BT62DRAFT_999289 [Guyanagaster necrorhizus MCA 3950]KAG7453235.1 hypothetical protein BT62DRAFT_999289 [Guyanagaster necrorhizus MCA 3950]